MLRRLSAIAVASGPAGVLNWSLVSMAQRTTAVANSQTLTDYLLKAGKFLGSPFRPEDGSERPPEGEQG